MIEFLLLFVFIGFIVGKIFPKGSKAYTFMIIIPILWGFEYGIFWGFITYLELLFGVVIAYAIKRRN